MAQGEFRQAWGILSRRPDSEHEQALIRAIITALLFFYLNWSMSRDGRMDHEEVILLWVGGLYHLFYLAIFGSITVGLPEKSSFRRGLGLVGDMCLTAYGIRVVGDMAGH